MEERQYVDGLVSVITPVFNAGSVIGKTLESVFSQTYKRIEIVLVDDCSSDNSQQVIEGFTRNHPEIVYFRQPTNQGAGAARNKALELARGQYVAFLDADDLWCPEKIGKQIDLLKRTGGFFSYSGASVIRHSGEMTGKERRVKPQCSYKRLLKNTMIITSSVVVDRNACGDFRMSGIRSGQDYATWLMLLRKDKVAFGLCEPLCKYRLSPNSLSSNKFKSIKQVYSIQRKQEKIGTLPAIINICCFCVNALIKRIF